MFSSLEHLFGSLAAVLARFTVKTRSKLKDMGFKKLICIDGGKSVAARPQARIFSSQRNDSGRNDSARNEFDRKDVPIVDTIGQNDCAVQSF